jgi:predicted N-acetyltransferase YhbS
LKITTRPAEPGDAQRFLEIAARAFAAAPEHARPKDRPEFVAHTHGPSNPAGAGWVTLAEEAGTLVGHVGAIPFRFRRRDGATIVGRQIGCYVVDGAHQGKGIGQAMLADQMRTLARDEPDRFLYGYPNLKSLGPLLKQGGKEFSRARTRIVLPGRSGSHTGPIERIEATTARQVLEAMPDPPARPSSFVRDKAFFRWRFLAQPAATRYGFAVSRRASGEPDLLLALAEHTALGRKFTILVDVFPEVSGARLGEAVLAARAAGGGKPVYTTTNDRWTSGPLSIAVPRRFDPRPVVGILMPVGRGDVAADLATAPIRTGDWMGF